MPNSPQSQHPVLLTPGEFGRRLGRSPRWGAYVVTQGLVESIRLGERMRAVPESEVQRCKESLPVMTMPPCKPAA